MSKSIDIKTEIAALGTFISTYDSDTQSFYNGDSLTCPNILESIISLSNNASAEACFSNIGRHSRVVGIMQDFVYEVNALQRVIGIISKNKSAYYYDYSAASSADQAFYAGEMARNISYLQGGSPDQGIII
jgi:hypothetical protein